MAVLTTRKTERTLEYESLREVDTVEHMGNSYIVTLKGQDMS